MSKVEIEYCVPCGLLDDAMMVQRHLLTAFGEDLDAVSLVTGQAGVFEVHVEGELVFDGQEEAYEKDALIETVREALQTEEVRA